MKKYIFSFVGLLMLGYSAYAGLLSHNDYTSGSVITAAGQNTNENNIVNMINGNIDSSNLSNGAVTDAKIAPSTITEDKFVPVLVSSFDFVYSTVTLHLLPDFASLVSSAPVYASSATGTSSDQSTTLLSTSVYSTGYPIFIAANGYFTASSNNSDCVLIEAVTRDGTGLKGCIQASGNSANPGVTTHMDIGISCIDVAPPVGTHTYTLTYSESFCVNTSSGAASLNLIRLRI